MAIAAPLIHLNGSGKENLQKNWREAHTAIRDAMKAVLNTTPHMRDYYPMENGDKAFDHARKDHERRMSQLHAMLLDFEELYHSTLK